jgi:hypothetical protein
MLMHVRQSILPPPLDDGMVQQLTDLANQIIDDMNAGQDPAPLIAAFNAAAGQQLDVAAFHAAWEGSGTQVLVETSLRLAPQRIPDITDAELLEIITYLMDGHGSVSEQSYWLEFLDRNLPHPAISNLIYRRFNELTPAQILAEAQAYKPIQL